MIHAFMAALSRLRKIYFSSLSVSAIFGCALAFWFTPPLLYAQSEPSEKQVVIKVGGNADFAPFEYLNKKGEPEGYTIDLMAAVAAQIGIKVVFTLEPWHQVRSKLENRQIDALTGVLYSKERDKLFDFSIPHTIISYSVFIRKDAPYGSIADVKGKSALVVEGVYAHDWLLANDFTRHVYPVDSPQIALQRLSEGEHDFVVLPRLHGLELMRQLKIDNIDTIGPPVLTQKFCFAVVAGNADLLARLNEGLAMAQKSGLCDEIYLKWFSVNEQRQRWLAYTMWTGIFLLAVVLVVFLWNLSLKTTVRRKALQLRKNEALLHQIIQGLPMATFVIDADQRVSHWNRACEKLTDTEAAKIIGTRKHKTVFYNNQRPVMSEGLLDSTIQGLTDLPHTMRCMPSSLVDGAWEVEAFFKHLGRKGMWLYGTTAIIRDGEGQTLGAIESWQDLTERKHLEAQLIQSQKMEALGTLATGISHDFGNILTAIMGNAELARDRAREADVRSFLDDLLKVSEHGNDLIRRILTFSRETEVTIESVRIDNLIDETVDLVCATLPSNILIHRHLNIQAWVAVDIIQFKQVLINLCTNAAHAMQGSTKELTITLDDTTEQEIKALAGRLETSRATFVKLTVSDTGHGIAEDILPRIFDPFFTTKQREQGTGMGLAVSQSIVQRLGGCITVKSEPAQGSDFHIYLPVVNALPE